MKKDNIDRTEKIQNICIVLLSIILFVYLAIGFNSMMNGDKMGFFNLRFYIMSSDSAEAGTSTGDLIIAKSIKMNNIKENDDIIYTLDDKMYVKKVIGTENNNGNVNIFVENDNIILNDSVQNAKISGKVIGKIRGVGNIALFIQSPMGTVNMLLIAICIFIIINKIIKNNEDNKEDAYKEEKSKLNT